MQLTRSILNSLRKLIFTGNAGEDAWIDNEAPLTPREGLVRRAGAVLHWGAILNGAVAAVIIGLLWSGFLQIAELWAVLLPGTTLTPGVAVLIGILGIVANFSILLLLSVGTQAQEFWVLIILLILILANGLALVLWRFWPALIALLPIAYFLFLTVRDLGAFHANPVMYKELRGRMRGVRSFAIITVFLALMGTFTVLLYLLQLPRVNTSDTIITGELGRLLFIGVVGVELLLIVFIVPALTASAITGERERKTYDLLQTTLLSAPSFIVGKMESALGYMLLLLLSAIPLQSIAFLFGGISSTEVLITFILLTVTALGLGALGMFFSALTERTLTATVRVYVVAIALVVGPFLISQIFFGSAYEKVITNDRVFAATPLAEVGIIYSDMVVNSLSPITSAFRSQQMLIDQQEVALFHATLSSDGSTIPVMASWIVTSTLYVGLTAFMLVLAIWQMRRSR